MRARLVVVAGHDPSGGAGIDADRDAASHFDVDALCVVTAWTRQSPETVFAIGERPVAEWREDLRVLALAAEEPPAQPMHAVKTGLLPSIEAATGAAEAVAELRQRFGAIPYVCDPVLRATTGESLAEGLGEALFEAEPILTPNLDEAALLTGAGPGTLATDLDARIEVARRLLEQGAAAVLLKGGHGGESPVRDLVIERGGEPHWCEHPRVGAPGERGIRGSGCRFASSVASQLARGVPLVAAADAAGRWVAGRIARSGAN